MSIIADKLNFARLSDGDLDELEVLASKAIEDGRLSGDDLDRYDALTSKALEDGEGESLPGPPRPS